MKISITKAIADRPKWKPGQTVDVTTDLGRELIMSGHAHAVNQDVPTEEEKVLKAYADDEIGEDVNENTGADQEEPPAENSTASN